MGLDVDLLSDVDRMDNADLTKSAKYGLSRWALVRISKGMMTRKFERDANQDLIQRKYMKTAFQLFDEKNSGKFFLLFQGGKKWDA